MTELINCVVDGMLLDFDGLRLKPNGSVITEVDGGTDRHRGFDDDRIKLRHFTIGTAIGLAPGCVALTIFGDRLSQALRRPDVLNWLILGVVAAALILGGRWLVRRIQRRSSHGVGGD